MKSYIKSIYFGILVILLQFCFLSVYANGSQEALDMLQDNTDGDVGLYFKRINGPVGVDFRGGEVFEPASAIKVLIHVHAMLQVQNNPGINLGTQIPWLGDTSKYDNANNYNPGGNDCYWDNTVVESDTLQLALRFMMESSDNALTQALRDFFGDSGINSTRLALGMTDTLLDHSIGCGGEAVTNHNRLTLEDVGMLHEAVANGLLNPVNRQDFYDLMIDQSSLTNFTSIVNQEAAKQGKAQHANSFRILVDQAYKGGSYGLSDGQYRSVAGWIRFPFSFGSSFREYVFGTFVDKANNLDLQNTGTNIDVNAVSSEMLRNMIRGALWTWKVPGLVPPDFEETIDKIKANINDTPPSPLVLELTAALDSVENAGRELLERSPDLLIVLRHLRNALGHFDHAVMNGMLEQDRGREEAMSIVKLARERAMDIKAVALVLGENRDLANIIRLAEDAINEGDSYAMRPSRSFSNFYDAMSSYEKAIVIAESAFRP